jgi:hypothetical protein
MSYSNRRQVLECAQCSGALRWTKNAKAAQQRAHSKTLSRISDPFGPWSQGVAENH